MPPIPKEEEVRSELNALIVADITATEKALNAFLWGARGRFFWDGNKRTSLTLANKIMISAGAGILTITDKDMEAFNAHLFHFYNTGEGEELKEFLYQNAIHGIER